MIGKWYTVAQFNLVKFHCSKLYFLFLSAAQRNIAGSATARWVAGLIWILTHSIKRRIEWKHSDIEAAAIERYFNIQWWPSLQNKSINCQMGKKQTVHKNSGRRWQYLQRSLSKKTKIVITQRNHFPYQLSIYFRISNSTYKGNLKPHSKASVRAWQFSQAAFLFNWLLLDARESLTAVKPPTQIDEAVQCKTDFNRLLGNEKSYRRSTGVKTTRFSRAFQNSKKK